jgi:hypothetical protein
LWIAPKLYMLEYIKEDSHLPLTKKEIKKKAKGKLHVEIIDGLKIYYHFRGKGLSTNKLTVEVFEKMDKGGSLTNTRDFQMKKVHIKRNSNQKGVNPFSVLHLKGVSKVVNKTAWNGREFKQGENHSTPWK